jgi:hypothetical protein
MGVVGICVVVLFSQVASTIYAFAAVTRHLPHTRRPLLYATLVPAANTALCLLTISVMKDSMSYSYFVEAVLLSLTGLVSYAVLTYLCIKFLGYQISSVMNEALFSIVKPLR